MAPAKKPPSSSQKASKTARQLVQPVSTGTASLDQAINTELAFYNKTGNMLAVWAAFALCQQHGVELANDVKSKFVEIANALVQLALKEVPQAREEAADLVLGTRNVTDGYSVFKAYADHKRDAAIIARERELLFEDVEALQDGRLTRDRSRSQTDVYELVATEFALQSEIIKRKFEKDTRFISFRDQHTFTSQDPA